MRGKISLRRVFAFLFHLLLLNQMEEIKELFDNDRMEVLHRLSETTSCAVTLEAIKSLSEESNTEATLLLGIVYVTGEGKVKQDKELGKQYFKLLEDFKDGSVHFLIGQTYSECDEIAEAKKHFKRASELDDPDGQNSYASILLEEKGDDEKGKSEVAKEAFDLFEKAALANHGLAMVNLATMFMHGRHVRKDLVVAKLWLQTAGESEDPEARNKAAQLLLQVSQMTKESAIH